MKRFSHRRHSAAEGQSMVEFAISAVIMIMILIGIADLGRAYYTYVALNNAAGEGAAYGSFNPKCQRASSGTGCADPNNIEFRAKNESLEGFIRTQNIQSVEIATTNPTSPQLGDPVTVTLVYDYDFMTPYFALLGLDSLTLRARATSPIRAVR
jgi:hypothetical protein